MLWMEEMREVSASNLVVFKVRKMTAYTNNHFQERTLLEFSRS